MATEFFKHVELIVSKILIRKSANTVNFENTTLSRNFIWKFVECSFSCQTEKVTTLHFKGNPYIFDVHLLFLYSGCHVHATSLKIAHI